MFDYYVCFIKKMGFDQNNVKLIILNSQHVVVYYVFFSDFLLMSLFLIMQIFPKCTNIGAVFLPTVEAKGGHTKYYNNKISNSKRVGTKLSQQLVIFEYSL